MSNDTAPAAAPGSSANATPAMHIGQVAARTELSLRSLRHWEHVGLLRPSGRTHGGFRLYTDDDVERILVIRRMKPLGFTLEEMKAVMSDIELIQDSGSLTVAARSRLAAVRQDATQRRARLAEQLDMADEFIEILGQRLV